LNMQDKHYLSRLQQDRQIEFSRSIIEGVEIKLCRNDPHAYKPHVHNELSLGYIIEGSTELTVSDRTIHYGSGDGVIIPPLMTHRCAPKDIQHWVYVMLFVEPNYYNNVVIFSRAKRVTGNQAQKLRSFIEQLLTEENPDTLENILIELLLEFGEGDISETPAANTSDIVKTIHDYILSHVSDDITLDKLQQISGLNKFSIIRNFKKLYLTTPAAYHLQYRVAEAKRLLSKGADVLDICEALRFYDQAHLIREFKKMYGVTPGAYIEQVKR
jgi:AraC-like DNA-binding protein